MGTRTPGQFSNISPVPNVRRPAAPEVRTRPNGLIIPIIDVRANFTLPSKPDAKVLLGQTEAQAQAQRRHHIAHHIIPKKSLPADLQSLDSLEYASNSYYHLLESGFKLTSPLKGIWQKYNSQDPDMPYEWHEHSIPNTTDIQRCGYTSTLYTTYDATETGKHVKFDKYGRPVGTLSGSQGIPVDYKGKAIVSRGNPVWLKHNPNNPLDPFIWVSDYDRNQVMAWVDSQNSLDPFLLFRMTRLFLSGKPITRELLAECNFTFRDDSHGQEYATIPITEHSYLYWRPGYSLDQMLELERKYPVHVKPGYQYPANTAYHYLRVARGEVTPPNPNLALTEDQLRAAGFTPMPHPRMQNLWVRTNRVFNEKGDPLNQIWIPGKSQNEMTSWYQVNSRLLDSDLRLPPYIPGSVMDRGLHSEHDNTFYTTSDLERRYLDTVTRLHQERRSPSPPPPVVSSLRTYSASSIERKTPSPTHAFKPLAPKSSPRPSPRPSPTKLSDREDLTPWTQPSKKPEAKLPIPTRRPSPTPHPTKAAATQTDRPESPLEFAGYPMERLTLDPRGRIPPASPFALAVPSASPIPFSVGYTEKLTVTEKIKPTLDHWPSAKSLVPPAPKPPFEPGDVEALAWRMPYSVPRIKTKVSTTPSAEPMGRVPRAPTPNYQPGDATPLAGAYRAPDYAQFAPQPAWMATPATGSVPPAPRLPYGVGTHEPAPYAPLGGYPPAHVTAPPMPRPEPARGFWSSPLRYDGSLAGQPPAAQAAPEPRVRFSVPRQRGEQRQASPDRSTRPKFPESRHKVKK